MNGPWVGLHGVLVVAATNESKCRGPPEPNEVGEERGLDVDTSDRLGGVNMGGRVDG